MNSIKVLEEKRCTGCSACKSICNKGAVFFQLDKEGFLHPQIDPSLCVECGMCLKVCPYIDTTYITSHSMIECYAATTKDESLYQKSSSGGIFATIAKDFIEDDGYVVGASMRENHSVEHIIINNTSDLELIQGSKYVQSNTTKVYDKILILLKDNKKVLFSGTPCQVAGLLNLVRLARAPEDKLFTIDIICHGVPSPKFLQDHIKVNYGNVSNVKFRHRTIHELNCFALGFLKGNKYELISPSDKDFYYACFSSMVSLRECCYLCKYATKERVSDITLGDMNSHKLYEKILGNDKSISVILLNTKHGQNLFSSINNRLIFTVADFSKEACINSNLLHPTKRPDERDLFYKLLYSDGFNEENVKKFGRTYSLKEKIKNAIVLSTTQKFRKKIQKLMGR